MDVDESSSNDVKSEETETPPAPEAVVEEEAAEPGTKVPKGIKYKNYNIRNLIKQCRFEA